MFTFIVVGASGYLLREALLAIRAFSDGECIVVKKKGAGALRFSSLCASQIELKFDRSDDHAFIDLADRFSDRMARTMLIAADLEGTRLLSRLRDRLRIGSMPVPDRMMLSLFGDRWNFHRFCREHGFNVAPAILAGAGTGFRFDAVSAQIGTPFMIKPTDASLPCAALMAGRMSHARMVRARRIVGHGPVIVQRYIEGADIRFDLLAVRGQLQAFAIYRQSKDEIRFVADDHLESLAYRITSASGYHGALTVSARMEAGSGRIHLVDAKPHFSGVLAAAACCGLNFVAESMVAARRNHAVSTLTSGAISRRHPLTRPAAWLRIFSSPDAQGRLLRARMMEVPSLLTRAWKSSSRPQFKTHLVGAAKPYH